MVTRSRVQSMASKAIVDSDQCRLVDKVDLLVHNNDQAQPGEEEHEQVLLEATLIAAVPQRKVQIQLLLLINDCVNARRGSTSLRVWSQRCRP